MHCTNKILMFMCLCVRTLYFMNTQELNTLQRDAKPPLHVPCVRCVSFNDIRIQ